MKFKKKIVLRLYKKMIVFYLSSVDGEEKSQWRKNFNVKINI